MFGILKCIVILLDLSSCKFFCRICDELKKETHMFTLRHINIVELLAIICDIGQYGVVMEYVLHGVLNVFVHKYEVCMTFSCVY